MESSNVAVAEPAHRDAASSIYVDRTEAMYMASDKVVLITGATGHQGGATIRHLAKHGGFKLRAMTRKPEGDAAKQLRTLGVEVVQGDFDDVPSCERALDGAWGVFAVQNTWEAGVAHEEEQGHRIAKLAKQRGVQHFVYTSVGSAHRSTGIPHFDNKFRVEQTVKEQGFASHVIMRPVFFMENLLSPWFLQGDKLVVALDPKTKLQMIAVDDIGRFGAAAFYDERFKGQEIDFAGDAITMPDAVAGLSEALNKKIELQQIPIEAVRKNSEDFALMLEWFDKVGYNADIASLEKRWGIRPMTFREWLKTSKK